MKPFLFTLLLLLASVANGASFRTRNFVVTAPTTAQAQRIATDAERHRAALSTSWLGRNVPDWGGICAVNVSLRNSAGGGATSFAFDNGRPVGIQMQLEGSWQSIIDDVLPHEVMHTVFATRFGRPLPRWLDEGAASTVESAGYQVESRKRLWFFLSQRPSRGIAFNRMFAMTEYPHDVMPLYDQGRSVVQFLINHKGDITAGRRSFVAYVAEGLNAGSSLNAWTNATRRHYGYNTLSDLQVAWLKWVVAARGKQPVTARQYRANNCRCVNCPCANCTCGPGCRIATGIRNGVQQIMQPVAPPRVIPQTVPVTPVETTPVETVPAPVTITTPVQTVVGPPGKQGPPGPPGTVDPELLARLVAQAVASLPPAPAGPAGPRGADAVVDYDTLLERMAADGRFRGADGSKGEHGDSFTAQEAQAMIEAAVLRLARGAEGQAFIDAQISAYMSRNPPATSTGLTQADLMALASNPTFVQAMVKALPPIPVGTYGKDGKQVDYQVYPFGTTIKIQDSNR